MSKLVQTRPGQTFKLKKPADRHEEKKRFAAVHRESNGVVTALMEVDKHGNWNRYGSVYDSKQGGISASDFGDYFESA